MATTTETNIEFLRTRNAELNNKALELLLENDRLKSQPLNVETVYRETEATREKLQLNFETIERQVSLIEQLKRDLKHHSDAFRGATATIDEQDEEIEGLKALVKSYESSLGSNETTDRILRDKIAELRGIAEHGKEEAQSLTVRRREDKWLIDTYRDKFAIMVEKIEELTPECECVEGEAVCLSCHGTGTADARHDDGAYRFTCRACKASGSVKCSECGEEAGS